MSSWKPGLFLRLVGAGTGKPDQTGSEPAERIETPSKQASRELGAFLEANHPRMLHFGIYIDDDAYQMTVIYALGGSVFARRRGLELARRMRSGMTAVNSVLSFAAMPSLPYGGVGDSGFAGWAATMGCASSPGPRRSRPAGRRRPCRPGPLSGIRTRPHGVSWPSCACSTAAPGWPSRQARGERHGDRCAGSSAVHPRRSRPPAWREGCAHGADPQITCRWSTGGWRIGKRSAASIRRGLSRAAVTWSPWRTLAPIVPVGAVVGRSGPAARPQRNGLGGSSGGGRRR
jgi:hypothetical protein